MNDADVEITISDEEDEGAHESGSAETGGKSPSGPFPPSGCLQGGLPAFERFAFPEQPGAPPARTPPARARPPQLSGPAGVLVGGHAGGATGTPQPLPSRVRKAAAAMDGAEHAGATEEERAKTVQKWRALVGAEGDAPANSEGVRLQMLVAAIIHPKT